MNNSKKLINLIILKLKCINSLIIIEIFFKESCTCFCIYKSLCVLKRLTKEQSLITVCKVNICNSPVHQLRKKYIQINITKLSSLCVGFHQSNYSGHSVTVQCSLLSASNLFPPK